MRTALPTSESQFNPTRCVRSMSGLGAPRTAWIAELRKGQLRLAGSGFVLALAVHILSVAI
ncbi:MAG TPA: hypothetical protein VEW26_03975, partial [Allosphingosinicella sp.]|nr:hypothetical protein [Allosphingosinicella sp.]